MRELSRRLRRMEDSVADLAAKSEEKTDPDVAWFKYVEGHPDVREIIRRIEDRVAAFSGPPPPDDYAPRDSFEERLWRWVVRHDKAARDLCHQLLERWSDCISEQRATHT